MRRKTILIIFMFSSLILTNCLFAAQQKDSIEEVQQKMQKAIDQEAKAQEKAENWDQEKAELIYELREIKTELEWTSYQKEKHQAYIKKQHKTLDKLARQKKEMQELRKRLEPYLQEVVLNLNDFIAADQPFLPQERQKRINFLQETLNDYHLDLNEKLRRILEALQIEASYGNSAEVTQRSLTLNDEPMEVEILRLGRVALLFRSLDGAKVGKWNQKTQTWESLPARFERPIRQAMEMANQERAVELVDLPVGPAKVKEN